MEEKKVMKNDGKIISILGCSRVFQSCENGYNFVFSLMLMESNYKRVKIEERNLRNEKATNRI